MFSSIGNFFKSIYNGVVNLFTRNNDTEEKGEIKENTKSDENEQVEEAEDDLDQEEFDEDSIDQQIIEFG